MVGQFPAVAYAAIPALARLRFNRICNELTVEFIDSQEHQGSDSSGSLFIPGVTLAQNCSLCYTQAAAAGARIVQGLRSGIVILVLPPMLICIGLAVMTYRKRNQFNEE